MSEPKFPTPEGVKIEEEDRAHLEKAKISLEGILTWSDELPEEFIAGKLGYHRHKFRTNWFHGALSACKLVAEVLEDKDFYDELNAYGNAKAARLQARATREEIEKVDGFIRRALEKVNSVL